MKTKLTTPSASAACTHYQADSTKLVSLLALATGAVAMPQTGNADIIYTDLSSSPALVGYAGTVDSFLFNLPGTSLFGFHRKSRVVYTAIASLTINYKTVTAGDQGGGAIAGVRGTFPNGFAAPGGLGATWNQGGATWSYVTVGKAQTVAHSPTSGYDHQYMAWVFADSTQGNQLRYGWVELSLSIGNVTGNPASGPNATIWGYAYDTTGTKLTMGQKPVPEPGSTAFMVMGALALGARGLRNWRRNRDAVSQS